MNNKYLRYILGFILLALILASFYFSKIMLFIVSIVFIIIATIEYRNMYKVKNIYPHKFLPEISGIIAAYIFIFNNSINEHSLIFPIIVMSFLASFMLTVITNRKPYILTSLSTISILLMIICGLYIIKLTYFFEQHYAWYFVIVYFIAVLSGDFLASRVGPRIKPIYIAPEISPKKTLAGAIANLFITCFACLLFKYFINYSILTCIFLGCVISIFSQFGDLAISTIKRDIGIKHSGNLFFDYGGILDRMDSFLFSAPATYYLLCLINIIH